MRKKKAEEQAGQARADGRVTPLDVQQVEFRLAFRGYNERDVDAFLDRVTEDLSWYLEENQRLGAVPATAIAAVPVSGDAADAARAEAERILAGAREEAKEIVRRAERDAAAIRGAAPGGDPRAAVAPFLSREREFLQSLGTLVQGHAEEVKEMVLALRSRVEATPSQEGNGPEAPAGQPGVEAASAAEIRERLGEPEPAPTPAVEEPDTVTIADEPAYSTEGAQAGEGRDRSLRELFWGED